MSGKLLFDQNLSRRLLATVAKAFPDCVHVVDVGLAASSDLEIWEFAKSRGYAIISKDGDFHQMSFLHGAPPKVIWLRLGNCSTRDLESFLNAQSQRISEFLDGDDGALLVLERNQK